MTMAALAGVAALAWVYLVVQASSMGDMSIGDMAQIKPWTPGDFGLMLLMWVIMMAAMMLPSAAPMILLFALVSRQARGQGHPFAPVSVFVSGYLVVWAAFCVGATLLQWGLERAALLSPMMVSTSALLGGLLLIAAGAYQWAPIKAACLARCRSPVEFMTRHRRKGTFGALLMGMEHGIFCLGCCWVLMGLLFVGGVMNLLWVAAIAGFVMLEKIMPFGRPLGRISGLVLALAGLWVILVDSL